VRFVESDVSVAPAGTPFDAVVGRLMPDSKTIADFRKPERIRIHAEKTGN
jgi:hypothetical protein